MTIVFKDSYSGVETIFRPSAPVPVPRVGDDVLVETPPGVDYPNGKREFGCVRRVKWNFNTLDSTDPMVVVTFEASLY